MIKIIKDIHSYSYFLRELIAKDFKSKYYKSFLGILWTLLNPLLMMLVMTLIFSTLFSRKIEYFPAYYLSGWLIFNFNSEATNQGLHSIVANASLIKKIYVPSYLFCVSKVLLALINKFFAMIPLLVVMLILRAPFHWTIVLIPIPIILAFFFSLGLGLSLASMAVYFRDLFHLYSIVTLLWMYLSALFYPIDIIPVHLQFLWNYNPLYHYIVMMRGVALYGTLPTFETVLYAISYSVMSMGIGVLLYKKLKPNFFLHI